jgi:hypothetical protein
LDERNGSTEGQAKASEGWKAVEVKNINGFLINF